MEMYVFDDVVGPPLVVVLDVVGDVDLEAVDDEVEGVEEVELGLVLGDVDGEPDKEEEVLEADESLEGRFGLGYRRGRIY